jgi:putative OPT family oligopeptide transporter
MSEPFVPYVPPGSGAPELTARAVLLGVGMAVLFALTSAYVGLSFGMTVSATVPAAVFAAVFLRGISPRDPKGPVLEINLAGAAAVTGEALAAGLLFTFPALLVLYGALFSGGEAGWATLLDPARILAMGLCALIGGLLGILLTVPLRRAMMSDVNLPYPEGKAAAEVIKASDREGFSATPFLAGIALGALAKSASDGLHLWKDRLEGTLVAGGTRLTAGLSLSPALLGIGYILGAEVSSWVLLGGFLGWVLMIPTFGAIYGWPEHGFFIDDPAGPLLGTGAGAVQQAWFAGPMQVAVAMIVTGGILTLWKLRGAFQKTLKGLQGTGQPGAEGPEKGRDLGLSLFHFVILTGAMFFLCWWATGSILVCVIVALIVLGACFVASAFSGYLAGVIGSSNNPISGITVVTLVFTGTLLLPLTFTGLVSVPTAMAATVLVGAVVCCTSAISGDSLQALKAGQLLGATPRGIHLSRIAGVVAASAVLPIVIAVLAAHYGLAFPDRSHPAPLAAPQSVVMALLTKATFSMDANVGLWTLGVLLAFAVRQFGLSPMAVAIGMFLPLGFSVTIMLGGVAHGLINRSIEKEVKVQHGHLPEPDVSEKVKKAKEASEQRGVVLVLGIIAGEASAAVLLAYFAVV